MLVAQWILAVAPAQAATPDPSAISDYFTWRHRQLQRVASIGYRISSAAAQDCPGDRASIGLVFEHGSQFEPAVAAIAGMAPEDAHVRIAAVADGSPAASAGIRTGDELALVVPPKLASHGPTFAAIDVAVDHIEMRRARLQPGEPLRLAILHEGVARDAAIAMTPGCGGWFDLRQSRRANAVSSPRWIQLTDRLLALAEDDDDAVAFVIGHEMGHRTLRRSAGQRDAWCGSACERAADTLAVGYMRRAGFDPSRAPDFLAAVARTGGLVDELSGNSAAVAARARILRAVVAGAQASP